MKHVGLNVAADAFVNSPDGELPRRMSAPGAENRAVPAAPHAGAPYRRRVRHAADPRRGPARRGRDRPGRAAQSRGDPRTPDRRTAPHRGADARQRARGPRHGAPPDARRKRNRRTPPARALPGMRTPRHVHSPDGGDPRGIPRGQGFQRHRLLHAGVAGAAARHRHMRRHGEPRSPWPKARPTRASTLRWP